VDAEPLIFEDGVAADLLDDQGTAMIAYHRTSGGHPILAGTRAAVTSRSRYAEKHVAAAVDHGVDQYVILGAGLDSFAYRSPLAKRARVFEVDAAGTQRWKRDKLRSAQIHPVGDVVYVTADFRTEPVMDRLVTAGLDAARPAFLSWLGVSFYLDIDGIASTVAGLRSAAPGSELVMDYVLPSELRDEAGHEYAGLAMPVAESSGEPWRSALTPQEMSRLLSDNGFDVVEQANQRDSVEPSLWQRSDALRPIGLWMMVHAVRR
jgi:methyltransferase (TIGR00027 family)